MRTSAATRFVRRSLSILALGGSLMLLAACGGSGHSEAPAAPAAPVVPPATTYTVGGTLSGLGVGQQVILLNNGADALTLTANGAFEFATPIADQGSYNVTVGTAPAGRNCSVTHGSGSNVSAAVTNVAVGCTLPPAVSWVYIPDYGNDRVLGYRIDRNTGARTNLPGSPYPAGDDNRWVAKTPDHRFLYTTNLAGNTVSSYSVNATTGELTALPGGPVATAFGPMSMEISPDGRFAYVANSQSASVSGYRIDPATGVLTALPGSPFTAGNIPTKIAITPDSRHLYVTNQNGYNVSGYSIDATTGALSPVAGSPWATSGQGYGMAMHPSGDFVYAVNSQAAVNVYRIDTVSGALTDVQPGGYTAATPWGWQSFTTNAAGTVGYVATPNGIRFVDIDTTTGVLTEQSSQPHSTYTNFVKTNPAGTRLYSSDAFAITTHISEIDASTSALSPIPGSPFHVGARPYNLVFIEP